MRTLKTLLVLLVSYSSTAQVYDFPNYSLTSHPTLEIASVERWDDQMVLTLTLKNERYDGAFCINKNTVLKNSLGTEEFPLVRLEGIPECPDVYRFKSIGEMITMILEFTAVPDEIKYIDLVENCDENCVNIRYILLDEELNGRLNNGIRLYELGRSKASLQVFKDLMETEYDDYSPVFGTIYLYLIALHYELGSSKDARAAFTRLKESNIIGREAFIETARETGIVR